MKNFKVLILNRRGNSILTGVVATAALALIAVGVGQAFFGMGKMKAKMDARLTTIDYEGAFIQTLGEQAFKNLVTCSSAFPRNLRFDIGDLGSATYLADEIRTKLSTDLGVAAASTSTAQIELNNAFNSCPQQPIVPDVNSPGAYVFCMGLQGHQGKSFQGMLGAFAQVRIDLGLSFQNSTDRLLGGAVTCDKFRRTTRPESREIKLSYKIYFKRFNDGQGVFAKSGSRVYSQ